MKIERKSHSIHKNSLKTLYIKETLKNVLIVFIDLCSVGRSQHLLEICSEYSKNGIYEG